MTPDLTIGIPTRNRREHLTSLLRRIDAIDDGRSYQVVIVDEQSSDDTPDLLARWRPRRADVTVVRHDNPMGVCGARNRIIEHAQAPYVSWIDDDDLPAPTRYGRQLDELRRTGFRWSAVGSVNIDADNVVTQLRHARGVNRTEITAADDRKPHAHELSGRSLTGGFTPTAPPHRRRS